jgi:hypothetical protein
LDIGIIILTSLFVITADIHHGKNGGGVDGGRCDKDK